MSQEERNCSVTVHMPKTELEYKGFGHVDFVTGPLSARVDHLSGQHLKSPLHLLSWKYRKEEEQEHSTGLMIQRGEF